MGYFRGKKVFFVLQKIENRLFFEKIYYSYIPIRAELNNCLKKLKKSLIVTLNKIEPGIFFVFGGKQYETGKRLLDTSI